MIAANNVQGKPPTVKAVAAKLQLELVWLEQQRDKKPDKRARDRVESLFIACVAALRILGYAGGWLDRKPDRRRLLKNRAEAFVTAKGNRALRDLLALTISAMEAASPQARRIEGLGTLEFTSKSDRQREALARARHKRWPSRHSGNGRKPEAQITPVLGAPQVVDSKRLTKSDFRPNCAATEISYGTS